MISPRFALVLTAALIPFAASAQTKTLTGTAAYGDWRGDAPGVRRHVKPADLPKPMATPSARNSVSVVKQPEGATLKTLPGFEVKLFASGLTKPRAMRVAPNGDIFVSESSSNRIRVLRPSADGSKVEANEIFATGLKQPFGIAFYPNGDNPQWVYVANTDSIVRFPYRTGDLKARGEEQTLVTGIPSVHHWTRDVVFSNDGKTMYVSVGSGSNVGEGMDKLTGNALQKAIAGKPLGAAWGPETDRADVLAFDPDGKNKRIYATGIRNCVGMAVDAKDTLWCSTNERDLLGDDLVPDYITRVKQGAFYGWPWYYIGANPDPRWSAAPRPDLKDKVTVPDILLQPHMASLQMMFYTGGQFPAEYKGSIFAAQHGSWNRSKRTGYKIIRGIVKDGVPTGEYEDFVTGFVIDDARSWGRPVGVAQGKDGSLLFSEDGNGTIWRVTHTEKRATR
jgi:glucose/arabinose dehydrogenase